MCADFLIPCLTTAMDWDTAIKVQIQWSDIKHIQGGQKSGTRDLFCSKTLIKSTPILTILSLLQREIHAA